MSERHIICINKIDKGSNMQERCISKTLSDNLSSLLEIQDKLQNIKDVKLTSIYSTITPNNSVKKISKKNKIIESTLCVKIKNKNIRQVQFGLCVDMGGDVIDDYLQNKKICNIHLNFHLRNLSKEYNNAYFIHDINNRSKLNSFTTQDNHLNSINLSEKINIFQKQIKQNNKISFFLPMFESYDNYEEFYEAIHNVMLKINYIE